MNDAELAAHVAAQTSMSKEFADAAVRAVFLDRNRCSCRWGNQHDNRLPNILIHVKTVAPETQSPDRRKHLLRRLKRAVLQTRQDPTLRREPRPSVNGHPVSPRFRSSGSQ